MDAVVGAGNAMHRVSVARGVPARQAEHLTARPRNERDIYSPIAKMPLSEANENSVYLRGSRESGAATRSFKIIKDFGP